MPGHVSAHPPGYRTKQVIRTIHTNLHGQSDSPTNLKSELKPDTSIDSENRTHLDNRTL